MFKDIVVRNAEGSLNDAFVGLKGQRQQSQSSGRPVSLHLFQSVVERHLEA